MEKKSDGKKQPLCSSCGQLVTRVSVNIGDKTLNGVRCKSCSKMYCLVCYNPAKQLLTCENCGHKKFSFLVDGE